MKITILFDDGESKIIDAAAAVVTVAGVKRIENGNVLAWEEGVWAEGPKPAMAMCIMAMNRWVNANPEILAELLRAVQVNRDRSPEEYKRIVLTELPWTPTPGRKL